MVGVELDPAALHALERVAGELQRLGAAGLGERVGEGLAWDGAGLSAARGGVGGLPAAGVAGAAGPARPPGGMSAGFEEIELNGLR